MKKLAKFIFLVKIFSLTEKRLQERLIPRPKTGSLYCRNVGVLKD